MTRGGVTTSYTYDAGGNILTRTTGSSAVAYGYGDAQWKDKLTSWNGQTITYDGIGNPLQYRDGISLTWKNGRQLSTTSRPGFTGSYTYDEDGNRLTRTVNGLTTTYYRIGGQLVGQYRSDGKDVGYFLDGNGGVYGIYYDDVTKPGGARTYYFIYNAQGDVIGLYNFNGTLVATYSYDEWGKCTVNALIPDDMGYSTTDGNHVAYINPFRYRGYMFDDETGFYYLGSRYYDPTTGRFINADGVLGANGDILSFNLFAYCSNNPINFSDPTGYGFWDWLAGLFNGKKDTATATSTASSGPIPVKVAGTTVSKSANTVALGSVTQGKSSTGYNFRIDKANLSTQTQKHIHITKGKENYSQNIDGTPHDDGNNSGGSPPKSVKKELKKKGIWDWDGNAAIQMAMDLPGPDQLQKQYPFFFNPMPGTVPNLLPSPAPSPAPSPVIPWGHPIPVM